MSGVSQAAEGADRSFRVFLWLSFQLFVSYLCVAMALPVISVFTTERLGFSNAAAGLAVGIAFGSTIATRGLAGRIADGRGSKLCLVWGLAAYIAAAGLCAAAAAPGLAASAGYGVLLAGRLVLGLGESLVTVGLIACSFGVMGPRRSGQVFAFVGMALYGAFAVGSPIGVALYQWSGFAGTMAACAIVPAVGLLMIVPVAAVPTVPGERTSFLRIIRRIWDPGLALALAGVGSAAIGAFVPLFFLDRGWGHPGLGLTCFGGAFVLVRIVGGHWPDRFGAMRVAAVSVGLEAAGQVLLWSAGGPVQALAGAALTGLGCSLMFPAMGIEVVGRVPAHLRGTAAGGLAGFQDLAFGLTGPVTGLLADRFGFRVVFLMGALAAVAGFGLVARMARR